MSEPEYVRIWGDPDMATIAHELDAAAARGVEAPAIKLMFSQDGTEYHLVVMRQIDAELVLELVTQEVAGK